MARRPPATFSEEQLRAWVLFHQEKTGRKPWFGAPQLHPDAPSWFRINSALSAGSLNWAGSISLDDWIGKEVPAAVPLSDITQQRLRAWVQAHRDANEGRFPHPQSGSIDGTVLTWRQLDAAMRRGDKGWVSRQGLTAWLNDAYPGERKSGADIPLPKMRGWVDIHRAVHGKFPQRTSGEIPGAGFTWAEVDVALRVGSRGLPAAGSLAKWLDQEYADERQKRPALTEALLRQWTDAHLAAHNAFPVALSGPIPGEQDTWALIDELMKNGQRGWTRRVSLARWLDAAYPEQRTVTNLFLEKWTDAYIRANDGRLPGPGSGVIPGAMRTWKQIDSALRNGSWEERTEQSLAWWLRRHYPEKHLINNEYLEKWVDAYRARHGGRFPTAASGHIPEAGRAWSQINQAMTRGDTHLGEATTLSKWIKDQYPKLKIARRAQLVAGLKHSLGQMRGAQRDTSAMRYRHSGTPGAVPTDFMRMARPRVS